MDRFALGIPDALSATCLYTLIDPAAQSLTYSSAGHVPALVVDPNGRAEFLDQYQDPPLVVGAGLRRRATVRPFPTGSTIVLCTDGLFERRGESIDDGLARLARAVTWDLGIPVDEMVDRVIDELLPGPTTDDVAMIAARLVTSAQPAEPAPS